jgi:hypothetical protein
MRNDSLVVDVRCSLVNYKDFGFFENGPRQTEQLLLAHAHIRAALCYHRI